MTALAGRPRNQLQARIRTRQAAAGSSLAGRQPDPGELLHAIRQIPSEWTPDTLSRIQLLTRLTGRPAASPARTGARRTNPPHHRALAL